MPVRVRSSRGRKANVLFSSAHKVTVDNVRDYYTRSSSMINSNGLLVKKSVKVNDFRPMLRSQNRKNRDAIVNCSIFGPYRHKLHKGYFFCHNCDMFDNLEEHKKTEALRCAAKHACKALHCSNLYPTTKLKSTCYNRQKELNYEIHQKKKQKKNKIYSNEINKFESKPIECSSDLDSVHSSEDDSLCEPSESDCSSCTTMNHKDLRDVLIDFLHKSSMTKKGFMSQLVAVIFDEDF